MGHRDDFDVIVEPHAVTLDGEAEAPATLAWRAFGDAGEVFVDYDPGAAPVLAHDQVPLTLALIVAGAYRRIELASPARHLDCFGVSERTALVVGGTGPTGPHVVKGLLERGYRVTILHTGRHEVDEITDLVEHIHTDPFDAAQFAEAIGSATYDLSVVMYGRLREIARVLAGRVSKFVSIGGFPVYSGWGDADALWPAGMRVPTRELDRLVSDEPPDFRVNNKVRQIANTELVVFGEHPTASHLRYPWIYGPGQISPREWKIVRRVLDGRTRIVLPDGGVTLQAMADARNAAAMVLAAVDAGARSSGQAYNVSDEWTPTLLQWVEIIAAALDHSFEIVSIPWEFAAVSHHLTQRSTPHHRVINCDKAIHQIGYRDVVNPVEGLTDTARWLARPENHPEPGSAMERSLVDRFDYEAEDRLIDVWQAAIARDDIAAAAAAADPGFFDRYAAEFDDRPGAGKGWTSVSRNG